MCDFGRSLEGPATTTCRNSSWTPKIGHCNNPSGLPTPGGPFVAPMVPPPGIRCPPIKSTSLKSTLEFTQTPLSDGHYPNSTIVRLICLEDGALVSRGVGEAECFNGLWTPQLGECDVVDTGEKSQETMFEGPGICQPLETAERGTVSS